MKRVLFFSSSCTVAVVVAACSGGTDVPTFTTPASATTSVPTSSPGLPPKRPGPPPPSDDPPEPDPFECPANVALTPTDLDQEIGWKSGAPAKGSCTAADLTKLASNFEDTGVQTYFDLAKGVSTTCKACAVSKDTDAKWAPIVGTAANNGETGFINYGACFGAIEGDACGKAIQYEKFCENIACNECAFDSKERAACVSKAGASGGMCSKFASTRTSACPSWTLNVKSCGDILEAIKTLCGA